MGAQRIIYVVDVRQSLHFKQLFAAAEMMGYSAHFDHVGFGMMLGADGKPFRTRDGGTIKLESLLDEAEERIRPIISAKWPDIPEHELCQLSSQISVGAVKYADLMHNLATDYRFEWEKFTNPDGNTGPYLQYTLVRINSILRAYEKQHSIRFAPNAELVELCEPEEIALAAKLLMLPDVLEKVAETLRPNLLCDYLYGLARAFNSFYSAHPILRAKSICTRHSRVALSLAAARTMQVGFECLNIPQVERM